MKKVTRNAVNAFNTHRNFTSGNTNVSVGITGNVYMSLHGNQIAVKSKNGKITITNAGWFTNTTKERLNAIDGVSIRQVKGVWYLNGKEWDGEPIII